MASVSVQAEIGEWLRRTADLLAMAYDFARVDASGISCALHLSDETGHDCATICCVK